MRTTRAVRLLAAVVCVLATAATLVVQTSSTPAQAADLSAFRAGNIVSDAVYFNPSTMTPDQIQAFLVQKGANCTAGDLCMKNYRVSTFTRTGTNCATYPGGENERAADVIWKVAQVCGINPQVLLVTLQKEQGLVTATSPTASKYRIAMGYGCPDTAACDAQYYGFFNQVYMAAWQFRRYSTLPRNYGYKAGMNNTILWHPNSACGSTQVYIENQATANLYNYTPYQPNAAALAAGYGLGNSCSSYGNRNFFSYFSDWFGSTQFIVTGTIRDWYWSNDGPAVLGAPVVNELTINGGWVQHFQRGSIWASGAGTFATVNGINSEYWENGARDGVLGFPVGPERAINGGWSQQFERGVVYVSAAGSFATVNGINTRYQELGGRDGVLGFPVGPELTLAGGWSQQFERGVIYVSAAGSFATVNGINGAYQQLGGPGGALGYPTSPEMTFPGGWGQNFERGAVYVTADGSFVTLNAINATYQRIGGPTVLGFPKGAERGVAGGWTQQFGVGSIYVSAAGSFATVNAIDAKYQQLGGANSALGFPASGERSYPGGWGQGFERGSLFLSAEGTFPTYNAINARYVELGGPRSALGFPVGVERTVAGGWSQQFQQGVLYVSAAGAWPTINGIHAAYQDLGGPAGLLGFPAGPEMAVAGGWAQQFQNGTLFISAAGAYPTVNGMDAKYRSMGGATSPLGFPTGLERSLPGGWSQAFQKGSIYISTAGSFAVLTAADEAYRGLGGPRSELGFPTGEATTVAEGSRTTFQHGTITCPTTGSGSCTVTRN
ncbi:LGFP repeat-containing protein [Geodermatophilus sp. CPCC 205506]|uniref:LGFP repeat-containing protein n=1 Tax=Geodermatophilus sp. CPCC 205506 TaxID=2936596 RepID=UPI003EEC4A4A